MRGTKQANEATAKKLAKSSAISRKPAQSPGHGVLWQAALGRTDPVTKTLSEIERIIKKKTTSSGSQNE